MAFTPRRRFNALTALRFFVAAKVVAHHSYEVGILPKSFADNFFMQFEAVSFFFVLSGFVMAYAYDHIKTWADRKSFIHSRFTRLWPAHAAAFFLLIALVAHPASMSADPAPHAAAAGLLNLSMLHAWIPLESYHYSFNFVSWTVSVEMAFAVAFLVLLPNFQKTWWWKLAITLLLAAAMIAFASDLSPDSGISQPGLTFINPLARLFEFTLGMVTCLAWRNWSPKIKVNLIVGTLLELAALGLVGLATAYAGTLGNAAGDATGMGTALAEWLHRGGIGCLSYAALIFLFAGEWGLLSRFLATKPFVALGQLSYGIFLMHAVLLKMWAEGMTTFAGSTPVTTYIGFCVATLLAGALLWACVERPVRLAGKKSRQKSREPRTIPATATATALSSAGVPAILESLGRRPQTDPVLMGARPDIAPRMPQRSNAT